MTDKTFYAVVDLETTGSQPAKGDRIIQFGCVLIQDRKVVQRFETKINPLKQIPENIQRLTGISNRMVANAPFFNDVAGFIWNLLQDCVFVAHNVLFDFRFLNEELKKAGYPPLACPAVDTVELAQILFPKEDSYSLGDLSDSFGLTHDRAHDALEDAAATAELLLMFFEKANRLPLVTLERLATLSKSLTMDTSFFFEKALEQSKAYPSDLPEEMMVVEGIALRKHLSASSESYREEKAYPLEAVGKNHLFSGELTVRPDQEEMMNATYQYLMEENPDRHLAIEAPAGIGKSLGYLLPVVFTATKEHPVIISTYTTLLQQQLIEKDLKELEPYLPFSIPSATLKSRHHYLSLEKFMDKLTLEELDKTEALYSSKLLVWLTETMTGDLDELGPINDQHSFWTEIRTTKSLDQLPASKWGAYDFYQLSRKRVKEASVIVTNHAFLCHDLAKETAELPKVEKVIVDEAHHLPKVAAEAATHVFDFRKVKHLMQKLGSRENEQSLMHQLSKLLIKIEEKETHLDSLEMNRIYLEDELEEWLENWLFAFRKEVNRMKEKNENIDIAFEPASLSMQLRKQAKTVLVLMEETVYLSDRLLDVLLKNLERWTKSEQQEIEEIYVVFNQLADQMKVLQQLFRSPEATDIYWMNFWKKHPSETFRLIRYEPESQAFLGKVLSNIPHVVYTSGTLSVNRRFSFFESQLGGKTLEKLQFSAPFDYQNQARVWVPDDLRAIKGLSPQQYAEMLVRYIINITQESDENALVLFNSLETLEKVYTMLSGSNQMKGKNIYAQGLSGSRERILKRFFRSQGALLLGADSFWEGIDLPGKSLRIVIVTRLPFESPDRPLVQARQQSLKKQNRNPFTEDSLPRAILKMKQGFGRLIRKKEDKGVLFVLDDRFVRAVYSDQFQQAVPEEVPIETVSMEDVPEKLKHFFAE